MAKKSSLNERESSALARENVMAELRLEQLRSVVQKPKDDKGPKKETIWENAKPGALLNYKAEVKAVQKTSQTKVKVLKEEKLILPEKPATTEKLMMKLGMTKNNRGELALDKDLKVKLSGDKEKPGIEKTPEKRTLKCGQCDKDKAVVICHECSEHYCARCFAVFHLKGNLRKHRSMPLQIAQAEQARISSARERPKFNLFPESQVAKTNEQANTNSRTSQAQTVTRDSEVGMSFRAASATPKKTDSEPTDGFFVGLRAAWLPDEAVTSDSRNQPNAAPSPDSGLAYDFQMANGNSVKAEFGTSPINSSRVASIATNKVPRKPATQAVSVTTEAVQADVSANDGSNGMSKIEFTSYSTLSYAEKLLLQRARNGEDVTTPTPEPTGAASHRGLPSARIDLPVSDADDASGELFRFEDLYSMVAEQTRREGVENGAQRSSRTVAETPVQNGSYVFEEIVAPGSKPAAQPTNGVVIRPNLPSQTSSREPSAIKPSAEKPPSANQQKTPVKTASARKTKNVESESSLKLDLTKLSKKPAAMKSAGKKSGKTKNQLYDSLDVGNGANGANGLTAAPSDKLKNMLDMFKDEFRNLDYRSDLTAFLLMESEADKQVAPTQISARSKSRTAAVSAKRPTSTAAAAASAIKPVASTSSVVASHRLDNKVYTMSPRSWKPEISADTGRTTVREDEFANGPGTSLSLQSARLLSSRRSKQVESSLIDSINGPISARFRPATSRSRPQTGRTSRISEQAQTVDEAFRQCEECVTSRDDKLERVAMDMNDEDSFQKLCAEFRDISRTSFRDDDAADGGLNGAAADLDQVAAMSAIMQQLGVAEPHSDANGSESARDDEVTARDSLEVDSMDDAMSVRRLH